MKLEDRIVGFRDVGYRIVLVTDRAERGNCAVFGGGPAEEVVAIHGQRGIKRAGHNDLRAEGGRLVIRAHALRDGILHDEVHGGVFRRPLCLIDSVGGHRGGAGLPLGSGSRTVHPQIDVDAFNLRLGQRVAVAGRRFAGADDQIACAAVLGLACGFIRKLTAVGVPGDGHGTAGVVDKQNGGAVGRNRFGDGQRVDRAVIRIETHRAEQAGFAV